MHGAIVGMNAETRKTERPNEAIERNDRTRMRMKTEKLEVEGLPALERCWRAIRTRDRVRPVKLVRSVPPGRLLVWGGWRARTTVEAAAGWIPPSAPHGRARDCAAARGLLESGPPNGTRAARAPGDPAT